MHAIILLRFLCAMMFTQPSDDHRDREENTSHASTFPNMSHVMRCPSVTTSSSPEMGHHVPHSLYGIILRCLVQGLCNYTQFCALAQNSGHGGFLRWHMVNHRAMPHTPSAACRHHASVHTRTAHSNSALLIWICVWCGFTFGVDDIHAIAQLVCTTSLSKLWLGGKLSV